MLTDPAIWGPILVAVTVYVAGNGIEAKIFQATVERRQQHDRLMTLLDGFPDEFDQVRTALGFIESNTNPPSSPYDDD